MQRRVHEAQASGDSATREAVVTRGGGGLTRSSPQPGQVPAGQAPVLLGLQRTVGNRAVCGLVQRLAGSEPSSSAPAEFQAQRQQPRQNDTGLPDDLKTGIEALSGVSLDTIRVHHGSPQPAQIGALAFTRGRDIHVAPGQEEHLPHEAWHLVQQAQGRVRPTTQLEAGPVNDDHRLEHEADVMGAKALRATRRVNVEQGPSPPVSESSSPIIQMVKFLRGKGKIIPVPDDYVKKKKERWASDEDILNSRGGPPEVEERREQLLAVERQRASEARKKERAERQRRVAPANLPQTQDRKQIKFPGVVGRADDKPADLSYRGMSIQNIRNLQSGSSSVFTVQNPTGTATALEHIVDDSETSPYLSFEAGGLGVSAGKYAPKPVDPDTHKPYGVETKGSGFLKQQKSYTEESRKKFAAAKRIGYVGGIPSTAGTERLDVSTPDKAKAQFKPPPTATASDRRQKAVNLAVADKEVLVKPGVGGITANQVPFVAKVKEVDEAYYRKHLIRQNSRKALGYYKPYGKEAVYSKIQIPPKDYGERYKFAISPDVRRSDDDSEDEMSDIEDINLEDYG